jgi:hypothetical protein
MLCLRGSGMPLFAWAMNGSIADVATLAVTLQYLEKLEYRPNCLMMDRAFGTCGARNTKYNPIGKLKVRKATGLLLGTNQTVAQIAHQRGIENAQYFITVFRKHYGATPQECRVSEIPEISGRAPQIDAKNQRVV